ncbi:hypothetical protein EI427_23955 [Flammeovirga pectinis]|uniref:Uncharacterized protein n=1 Tax=Flammeovirga pectinis TaxID=2494373 RepID=A0A3Q9FV52_9BACT|nr:hypothetical protein [Flammeovirga pectinis]AZQ65272.1 hypothetical protein EI427_23955 [Flammeovirga pectinis]
MKKLLDYLLNFIIGVFPFIAIFYHLFFVHKAYRIDGILVAIISFFTPVLSDFYWFIQTMSLGGFRLYHALGIVGIFAGILWYYRGKEAHSEVDFN